METTDPLQLDSLPSDPKEIVLRMLGMTTSSLKEIDSNISGTPNAYIKGLKLDSKKILTETLVNVNPELVQQQPGFVQSTQHPPLVQQHPQQALPVPVSNISQTVYDPNQLEFDFFKKIKPEDLEYRLKCIESNLKQINDKLEILCARKVKKKLTNPNATNNSRNHSADRDQ